MYLENGEGRRGGDGVGMDLEGSSGGVGLVSASTADADAGMGSEQAERAGRDAVDIAVARTEETALGNREREQLVGRDREHIRNALQQIVLMRAGRIRDRERERALDSSPSRYRASEHLLGIGLAPHRHGDSAAGGTGAAGAGGEGEGGAGSRSGRRATRASLSRSARSREQGTFAVLSVP